MPSPKSAAKRRCPRLTEMLQSGNVKTVPIVVRALGKLGDARLIETLMPFASRPEREVRIEAIQALSKIIDERHVDQLRTELQNASVLARPDDRAHRACSDVRARKQTFRRPVVAHAVTTTGPSAAMSSPTSVRPAAGHVATGRGRENTADVGSRRRTGRETRGNQLATRHRYAETRATSSKVATSTSIASAAARSGTVLPDGRHGRRRAAHPEIPEPERVRATKR